MMTRKDIEELGWIVKYDKHVFVAEFMNYTLYWNHGLNFTIHKESNGNLEHEEVFKGPLTSKDSLEEMMRLKKII